MTATTARSVMALVAILSLVLSLFAIARPVIANHDVAGPAVTPTVQPGNPSCPAGTTEIKFEGGNLVNNKSLSATIDGNVVTVQITNVDVGGGSFDFNVTGGVALVVIAKGGPNANVYDYRPTGTAHDDGLTTPINPNNNQPFGLSHISFCVVPIVAEIEVDKDGPDLSKIGDPTDYTVTITNTGNVLLHLESVIDSLKGNITADVIAQCGTLAVDEVCAFAYSYTPVEGDPDPLLNTVEVSANSAADFTGADATGSASASVNLFQPSIEVTKDGDVTEALVGDTVTYTVTIENTSSADSPNLVFDSITDSLQGDLTDAANVDTSDCGASLAAGGSCTITYTREVAADDPDPLVNTVSVESHPDGFPNDIDDSDDHEVNILAPSIDIEKDGPDLSKATDPAVYTVTIANDGEVTLFIESITDSLQGDLTDAANVDTSDCGASLAPGASCEITYTYTVAVDDPDPLLNEVTVDADTADDFSGTEVTDTDSVSVELFQPSIEVTKDGDVSTAAVGDTVTYTVTIENTSSADSPDLVFDLIDDSLQGDLTDAANVDSSDCGASLAAGDSCTIVYSRTILESDPSPLVNTVSVESHPDGFPNDVDDSDDHEVVIEELGSITINKEVECEECETRTPGFWFNAAGSHDDETNALMAELAAADGGDTSVIEVNIDGTVHEFATADDVRAFVEADRSGDSDGEPGLSRDGALLRHYLSTWLNVALNGEECDLLSRMLGDQTVEEILAEAAAALAADDEDAEVAALEKLTTINESDDAEENPLTCGDSGSTSGDGFMFELFAEADFPDGDPIDSGTTGDDGPGTLIFEDLPLGTYVLVETGNDGGQECEIVSVEGGVLNADGTVTVEITSETPDVVLTIVNECEGGEEEPNPGDITVIKEAGDDTAAEFAFSATWDSDGFVLTDGDAEFSGDLEAGEFTVTETLTPEQIAAGWSLDDIDCGDADVTIVDSSVTITLGEGESVTCTFTNEQEDQDEEEGELEIIKLFCPTVGDDLIFVFGPLAEEPIDTLQTEGDEMPSDEGCTLGAPSEEALGATFTITGGDLEDPLVVTTEWDNILTLDLAPGDYTIVEEGTGLTADFTIADDSDTAVVVFNFGEEEEEEGNLKILKFYCMGEGDPVFTVVDGDATLGDVDLPDNCESPEPGDATFTLTMGDVTSGEFTLGDDGARLIPLTVGTYVLNEVDPNEASSDPFDVTADETTTAIVFDFVAEGEQPGGTNVPPREGTQGGSGGPGAGGLPNTALAPTPTGSVPAALLALLMLATLGGAGYAVRAEARRRR